MKREGTFGAAAALAILALVGVSHQPGSKSGQSSGMGGGELTSRAAASASNGRKNRSDRHPNQDLRWCSGLQGTLEGFLHVKLKQLPGECYPEPDRPKPAAQAGVQPDLIDRTADLKFVIALTPDPIHTHLSLLFDQFAVAIQEGAQDEHYEFDSSWLPWDDETPSYMFLADELAANLQKTRMEDQPGVILFRKSSQDRPRKDKCDGQATAYCEGLVVFVVGEEATAGIHNAQFRNALEWIDTLQPGRSAGQRDIGILGPTFSGSIPSLAQALASSLLSDQKLYIYSGSVSSEGAASSLQGLSSQIVFHSFVRSDNEILQRFLDYMKVGGDLDRIAILSEDETAYGAVSKAEAAAMTETDKVARKNNGNDSAKTPLVLYYPRDISALRGAYQNTSLFEAGTPSNPAEVVRRNLPTDLADPFGKVHDSIRSYGGNQTPQEQEALLTEIVAELRDHGIEYILIRGSNALDQLFLAKFLRRSYPDGRLVIFSSDLLFIRERGANGLTGDMVLSTYPLFPLQREWTEHAKAPAANRVFSLDAAEGTYIALRVLLADQSQTQGDMTAPTQGCHVDDDSKEIFVPSVSCSQAVTAGQFAIPDYAPPFWLSGSLCDKTKDSTSACYPGPPVWLSVVGMNRYWPLVSLEHTNSSYSHDQSLSNAREDIANGIPKIPLAMKVLFLVLLLLAGFHACCCWTGSYTAKPNFRAHFASHGDWRHTWLIFSGSCCIAFAALLAGQACRIFHPNQGGLGYSYGASICTVVLILIAFTALVGHAYTAKKLAQPARHSPAWKWGGEEGNKTLTRWVALSAGIFVAALIVFWLLVLFPLELRLAPQNEVLTHWRAMHLGSGVSPLLPFLFILAGLYLCSWLSLHGLALFGPDQPRLPIKRHLRLNGNDELLRMFSEEDAARQIRQTALPLNRKVLLAGLILGIVFPIVAVAMSREVPIRSLGGGRVYAIIFFLALDVCWTLTILQAYSFCVTWTKLKRLLSFLDRLPLRTTMRALHGFSWGSIWRMGGNVLEVRYKLISRQIECMNHTIAALQHFPNDTIDRENMESIGTSLLVLSGLRATTKAFGEWYSKHYLNSRTGDLESFEAFQLQVARTSGILLSQLLVPSWRLEQSSLLMEPSGKHDGTEPALNAAPRPMAAHLKNSEELVCLNYLGFVQNILGRLRTMALTMVVLFLAATFAVSSYPFDPRQGLSIFVIVFFVVIGVVIVKVYAEMHRDSTLSNVTNTNPGELGSEFWLKIVGFGIAPVLGVLARIFPGALDSILSWLQPGISALK